MAVAVYPDGRQVVAAIDLAQSDFPRGDPLQGDQVIVDSPGAVDLADLRELVIDPRLASLAMPQGD